MSKFLEALECKMKDTKSARRYPIPALEVIVSMSANNPPGVADVMRHYKIGVSYGFEVVCLPVEKNQMVDNVFREMQDIIYGDFRSKMFRLERAIYKQDDTEIKSIMRDIFTEIGVKY